MFRKKKQHNLHRRAVCRKCRPPFFYSNTRRFYFDRYRKGIITGEAPSGGSTGTGSGKGTKSPDASADSDRRYFCESMSGTCIYGFEGTGETVMRSDGKRVTRETSRLTGTFLFFPKGALTHHPDGAVVFPTETVRSAKRMRLLRQPDGQCHISAELLSLSTQLVCGKRSQNTVSLTDGIPPTARTNLPPAALSAVMTLSSTEGHFLFHKEKQKLHERIGITKWRSIIWKPKSSAGAQDDPPWLLRPI